MTRQPNPDAVIVEDLHVSYGDRPALRGVSLRAAPAQITAILGPNGAGKSSLLRCLCTVHPVSPDTVRVFGVDPARNPRRVREHLGVVFQEQTLDSELTVERNLRFHARLYGVPRQQTPARISDTLALLDLTSRRRDRVAALSGGLARRVEIARALLHQPRLLVLDEPTVGLDPQSRRAVWSDLRRLRDALGLTVVFSTHYMEEAEFADTIAILRDGTVAQTGTPRALKTALDASSVLLRTRDDEAAENHLNAAGYPARLTDDGVVVYAPQPEDIIGDLVRACPVAILWVSVRQPSLDDVFLAAQTVRVQELVP